ncbi:MAG TPA: hypothetical protein VEJ87_13535 [Acidimicrobiales bacterium]|nr:hypothetical protein [Acidimicrobiales bacterium]
MVEAALLAVGLVERMVAQVRGIVPVVPLLGVGRRGAIWIFRRRPGRRIGH